MIPTVPSLPASKYRRCTLLMKSTLEVRADVHQLTGSCKYSAPLCSYKDTACLLYSTSCACPRTASVRPASASLASDLASLLFFSLPLCYQSSFLESHTLDSIYGFAETSVIFICAFSPLFIFSSFFSTPHLHSWPSSISLSHHSASSAGLSPRIRENRPLHSLTSTSQASLVARTKYFPLSIPSCLATTFFFIVGTSPWGYSTRRTTSSGSSTSPRSA
jgi:hypothetical protein